MTHGRALLPLFLIAATPVWAQDSEEDRDRGFIAGLIEDNLSSPGLQVRIDGFEGALSSEASIERLQLSDEEGAWLTMENVVLDWNRSALLRGRLEVESLSAELIDLARAPLPPEGVEALPEAGASEGFALPDLPVSIDIQSLSAERIDLGAPLLGQAVSLMLQASAQLADGSGQATIEATRIDGQTGRFSIAGGFVAEEDRLSIDIAVEEAEGGLAATLLQLPGAPAIELTVAGDGPLDDFTADIAVASEGVDRLAGQVALDGVEGGRRFDVDLGGDVTALLAPRYTEFFGNDVRLVAEGTQFEDGRLELSTLDLATKALQLTGVARIGADGWPTFIDVIGAVEAEDGTPILLPTADNSRLARAGLAIDYDAEVSDVWTFDLDVLGYEASTLALGDAAINGAGRLTRSGGTVEAATAEIAAALNQLDFVDPALAQALGARISFDTDIDWRSGDPVRLTDLRLSGRDYGLNGTVAIDGTDPEVPLTIGLDLEAMFEDLSRLSAIAGQDLSGAAEASVEGDYAPTAGSFDIDLSAVVRDLALQIPQADALLEGETTLDLSTRRTLDGTFLDAFDLRNDQLSAKGSARILGSEGDMFLDGDRSQATFEARIEDGTRIDPRLNGPITFAVDATQDEGEVWSGDLSATAPEDVTVSASGVLTGPTPDVTFAATIPRLDPFAPGVPGGLSLEGRATTTDGAWFVDAAANGPYDVTARVMGLVTGDRPEIEFQARVPELSEPVPAIADIPALQGAATLNGTLTQVGGVWSVETDIAAPSDIALRVTGPVTGPAPRIEFTAEVPDVTDPVPALSEVPGMQGSLSLDGVLSQVGEAWSVDTSLAAPSGVTLRVRGPLTGPAPRLDFAGTVPNVADFAPDAGIDGRVDLDGSLEQMGEDWAADVTVNGPLGARITAESVLTRSPLQAGFTIDVADLSQLAPVEGGVSVAGEVLQTDDGFRVDVDGTLPYAATVDATVDVLPAGLRIDANGRVPQTSVIAPQLSGPLTYDVVTEQVDGQWRVSVDVNGAQSIEANVEGIAAGPEADLDIGLRIANVAAFAPGFNGALDLDGRVFQQGGNWAADIDASGPLGATLSADGVLTGPSPNANFTLAVPDIGPLVPEINGPLRVAGTAEQRGTTWALDVDVDGPAGTTAAINGDVAADASTLNLSVTGSAPLGLANGVLAPRRVEGVARFDLDVNGPPALDSVAGTITVADADLSLPTLRNGLEDIDATIALRGGAAQVSVTAAPFSGGRVSVQGPVTLAAPFNANLTTEFDVTLADPTLYTAEASGQVRINGPLTGGATIAGAISIDGAEISVPSSGLTAIGDLPAIRHVGASDPVETTLRRADQSVTGQTEEAEASDGPGAVYTLDLRVDAPGQIFIRGRGLDAELGGSLRVTGTTENPITAGGFELERGRLDILEQRFEFDEGRISFQGSLVPFVRLVAVTQADTVTASIVIEGPADDIQVRFESSPEVPQEEVVALIFFGRDLSQLSPLQALQLANSVAILAGGGSGGLLNNLRGSAGLDDLDVTTDSDGNVAVRAGKNLSENVYTDVQVDQTGEAEISLNLDIGRNLTVRGSAGATGTTSLGLFFEKDY